MVAAVSIFTDNAGADGAPGSNNDIDGLGPPNMQHRTDDTITVDATNGVRKPAAGTNYGFAKSSYLRCDVAPSLQIDNVGFYADGANSLGTGVDIVIGDELPTKNSGSSAGYIVATGTVGTTGNEMTTFYTGITGTTSIFTFTSVSRKTITISEAGGIIDAIGETTNYMVFQATVLSTASIGQTVNETTTVEFDEI